MGRRRAMKTTLGEIWSHNPCGKEKGSNQGWDKLTTYLGTSDLDTQVSFEQILKSNGILNAVWALRVLDYRDQCLFIADVSESVLHMVEARFPGDTQTRKYIDGIRRWHSSEINDRELESLKHNAARDLTYDHAYAVTAHVVYTHTLAYVVAAYDRAADDIDVAAARTEKWKEIEKIFKKHFCKEAA